MIKWPSIRDISQKTTTSLVRFPFVYLSAAVLFTICCLNIHNHNLKKEDLLVQLMTAGSLGISLFIALRFMIETRLQSSLRSWLLVYGAGLAVLVLFVASYEPKNTIFYFRACQLALAFHLLVALSASFNSGGAFWRFNAHMFSRICITVLYSWTLYLGLAFAMWAVDKLLGVPVNEKSYAYLAAFIGCLYNTWFFMIGFPDDLSRFEETTPYPTGLRVFAQFILMPLVVVYLLIFYAYVGKIAVQMTWPAGLLGYLVCGVSFVGILTHLLLDPLRDDERYPVIKVYALWFYRVLFPLAILLAMATSRRVAEYGLTERRYFLYVIAFWIGLLSLYLGWMKRRQLKAIPFSMFLLTVLTVAGPWSAYSVSKWDQTRRLEKTLEKIGALQNGKVKMISGPVAVEDRRTISSKLDYLIGTHGKTAVEPLFGDLDERPDVRALMKERIGIEYMEHRNKRYDNDGPRDANEPFFAQSDHQDVIDVRGYQGLIQMEGLYARRGDTDFNFDGKKYKLELSSAAAAIVITANKQEVLVVPLLPAVNKAKQYATSNQLQRFDPYPQDLLTAEAENEHMRAKVLIKSVHMDNKNPGQITTLSGVVLLQPKK